MTITLSTLTSGILTPSGANIVTASVSPSANTPLLAFCSVRLDTDPGTNVFSVSTGLSMATSFTRLREQNFGLAGSDRIVIAFGGVTGTSPGSGTITFTESGVTYNGTAAAGIIQCAGANTITPFGTATGARQDNGTGLTGAAITGTPSGADITFAALGSQDGMGTITPSPGSWSDILDTGDSTDVRLNLYSNTAKDLNPSWSWSGSLNAGEIGFIINADILMPQIWM